MLFCHHVVRTAFRAMSRVGLCFATCVSLSATRMDSSSFCFATCLCICLRLGSIRRSVASQRAYVCLAATRIDSARRARNRNFRVQDRPPERPKSTLGGSKIDLRSVQNRPWEGLKSTSERHGGSMVLPEASKSPPRTPQERHKSAQERPTAPQELPKSPPRATQWRPRVPQEVSQGALEGAWGPS